MLNKHLGSCCLNMSSVKIGDIGMEFAERFGKKDAERLIASALSHKLTTESFGDDFFIWVLLKCIGWDCVKKYRKFHHLDITWKQLKRFCLKHREAIMNFKGDWDYISVFSGDYNWLVEEKPL